MLGDVPIPKLMATQHPDSVVYVDPRSEVGEAVEDFLPLEKGGRGCDEKMVDYEGKLTPYHQMKWIVEEAVKAGLVPGEDFLLTPRVPNPRLEDEDRHLLTLAAAVMANSVSMRHGGQVVRYIILPMTESTLEIALVWRRLYKIARLVEEEFPVRPGLEIHVVPLFESVARHVHIDSIMEGLRVALMKHLGVFAEHFRVLIGKSDAALHNGHVASAISVKLALAKLHAWAEERMLKVYPIIGMGKPPFRGHLAEWSREWWPRAYRGYATVTMQSALRLDTRRGEYVATRSALLEGAGLEPDMEVLEEASWLVRIAEEASKRYEKLLAPMCDAIVSVARFVPRTRARMEGYGRELGGAKLPRAIRFTCSLYTMGVGPALIGSGTLLEAVERSSEGGMDKLIKLVPSLPEDFSYDLALTRLDLAKRYLPERVVEMLRKDVEALKEHGIEESWDPGEEYWSLLYQAREAIGALSEKEASKLIVLAARLRRFLG